jgi:hypothetical protein
MIPLCRDNAEFERLTTKVNHLDKLDTGQCGSIQLAPMQHDYLNKNPCSKV